MNWISDWALPKIQGLFKREAPENLWHNCPSCQQMIFHRDLEKALRVCSHCGHHMRLGAAQRLEATLDPGFSRIELPKAPADPLRFRDQRRYADRLRESQTKTSMDDAVAVAHGTINGQRAVVAPGGKGGFGNEHFKGPLKQTPTECTPGEPAVERRLRFELKLIADIGLVGLPNAGKSTLLRAVSRANAKVGAYPFTTLSPQLGIAELDMERRLVFADLPGLIEGAAQGAGLGHDFLKHVERTRAIVHLVDLAPLDGSDPVANWRTIRGELLEFSAELAEKPEIVVLNKLDLVPAEEREARIERFAGAIGMKKGERPLAISGATGEGVRPMLEAAWKLAGK